MMITDFQSAVKIVRERAHILSELDEQRISACKWRKPHFSMYVGYMSEMAVKNYTDCDKIQFSQQNGK